MKKEYYLEQFKQHLILNDKASGTIEIYLSNINLFIKFYMDTFNEEFEPSDVIETDIQEFRNNMLNKQGLKATTINNKLAAIKEYFSFLYESKFITKNVALKIKKIKLSSSTVPRSFTLKEFRTIKRIIYRNHSPLDILILELLSRTGCRISELINIKIRDIDLKERSGKLNIIGKGLKARSIPLPHTDLRDAISEYLKYREKKNITSEYLLVSERQQPFTRSGLSKLLKKYEKPTGIKIHAHLFRSFFAITLLKNPETNIHHVMRLLGHSSIESSAIYLKLHMEDLEKSVAEMNI